MLVKKAVALLLVLSMVGSATVSMMVSCFLVGVPGAVRTTIFHPATTTLFTKKGNKTKKRAKSTVSSRAGGFGSKTIAETPPVDDYAIFPALEQGIQQTLVPATTSEVSNEIYQRLDQIYGFPDFNYEELEQSQISFSDMLSAAADSTDDLPKSSSSSSSSLGSNDLDDLLAAATGGTASTSVTKSAAMSPDQQIVPLDISEHLSKLPPFSKIRTLHVDPLVLAIDDFFTPAECDRYVENSLKKKNRNVMQSRSPTVGKDAAAKAQRTSTTFYHMYKSVPELMSKASRLLGLSTIGNWEEPQTVRYRRNEKFTWHLDALGPMEQQESSAGQRTATLLVYLTDLQETEGGATLFRDLGGTDDDNNKYLRVQPKKGMALLFFPAAGGIPDCPFDIRTLHSGQVVAENSENDKWIAQLWLRQSPYRPTAPPGNRHVDATAAIAEYCTSSSTAL